MAKEKKGPVANAAPGALHIQLAKDLNQLEVEWEVREKALEEIKAQWEEVCDKLVAAMKADGIRNFVLDDINKRVEMYPWFRPNVLDRVALMAWLRKDKEGKNIIKPDVHPSTLKSFLSERMKIHGKLPPAAVVDVLSFAKTKAKLVSVAKKA